MKNIILIFLLFVSAGLLAQNSKKMPKYFGETFTIDSVKTLLITVQYNSDLYSSKYAFDDYYGNIIFYNYINNTQKLLFENDTYIKPFRERYYYRYNYMINNKLPKNIAYGQIYMFVKNNDYDKNKKIDSDDPFILYTCDFEGNNLKAITPQNENAVSFELFNKQGFMLIRMQRDYNNDENFTYKDKDFYYLKVDLQKFIILSKIEIKTDNK